MIELLRKKYKLELELFGLFNRPKKIEIYYEEATFGELINMKSKINHPEKLYFWLKDFLMNKTTQNVKLTPKLYNQLTQEQFLKIIEILLNSYAKGYFKKDRIEEKLGEKKKKNKPRRAAPPGTLIAYLMENTNETMESLLNMTWAQIEFVLEGIVWNHNEQTEEGKRRNQQKLRMTDLKDSTDEERDQETVRRLIEKMDKKKQFKTS